MSDDEALKVLVALGDSIRFEIFRKLQREGELSTVELQVGKAASTMSHHLRKLIDAGVVEAVKNGKHRRYRVSSSTISSLSAWVANQAELTTLADLTRFIEDNPI